MFARPLATFPNAHKRSDACKHIPETDVDDDRPALIISIMIEENDNVCILGLLT